MLTIGLRVIKECRMKSMVLVCCSQVHMSNVWDIYRKQRDTASTKIQNGITDTLIAYVINGHTRGSDKLVQTDIKLQTAL